MVIFFKLYSTYWIYIAYSDNFAALGVSPSKSHTNFIGYSIDSFRDGLERRDLGVCNLSLKD